MKRIDITLKGIGTGLLQNRMTEDALLALRDKTAKKADTAEKLSLYDEAMRKIHFDVEGRPCVPKTMLFSTLMGAGVFIRLDKKRQLSTKESSMLPGLMFIDEDSFPLLNPEGPDEAQWGLAGWIYKTDRGRNPNGGEAVCIVRPLFEKWAIRLTCTVDTETLPVDTYLRLFQLAGTRIGIGDWRPARKGSCGMFAVTKWVVLADSVDLLETAAA